ncbi:MAG: twin-arginine translocase subunit TatC [Candidatus Altiarchaeota archaeon]
MKASFTEHLIEFRRRLIVVLAFLIAATVLSYPLAQPLLLKMKEDLLGGINLVIIEPQEAVMAYFSVSLLLGFTFTLPVLTYHLWAFIAPGLLKQERRMLAYLIIPSVFMFLIGVAFGYYVLLPVALKFLLASAEPLATPMISLGSATSFITSLLLALGVVFQLPLITAALSRLGVLDYRTLARYRRHVIVLIFLIAGIITADPGFVTQTLLAVPMVLLYEVGILTSRVAGGKRC